MQTHDPDLDMLYDEYAALVVKRHCDVCSGPKPKCPDKCPPNIGGFCACYTQMDFDDWREMQDGSSS